jgi:hypothetical protein
MATVNKNFRIKHGLIVEGTSGTINGQNILTETGSDQYILDLIGGETLVKSVSNQFDVSVGGELSLDRTVVDAYYDAAGSAAAAQTAAEDYADGLAVNYDAAGSAAAAQTAAEDYADGLAVNYDAAGAAAAAQTAAEDYADGLASNYDPAGSASAAQTAAQGYADGLASNYDPAGSASAAQTAAQNYADDLINDASSSSAEVWSAYKTSTEIGLAQGAAEDYADGLAVNYDAAGSATAAEGNAKDYTDLLLGDATIDGSGGNTVTDRIATAVADLVDAAPAALDTLNELAAALGDAVDAQGLATAIGNKLPLAGGTLTGALAMGTNKITGLGAPTSDNDAATKKYVDDQTTSDVAEGTNLYFTNQRALDATNTAYDAAGSAAAAQTAAEDYADGLAVNYDAAGVASGLVDDALDGTTAFTAINLNSVSKQKAAQSTIATAQNGSSIMSWAKSDYGTAKAWVKFATATHSQISEVLLTSDSTGNISITEFGMVGTNGSLGSVGASYLAGNIAIEVDTVHAATTVTVVATLIK